MGALQVQDAMTIKFNIVATVADQARQSAAAAFLRAPPAPRRALAAAAAVFHPSGEMPDCRQAAPGFLRHHRPRTAASHAADARDRYKPQVDIVAGARHVRQPIFAYRRFRRSRIPPNTPLRSVATRRRQRDFQEIAASRGFGAGAFARRKRACFDEPYQLAGGIEPADFVEHIVAQTPEFEFEPIFSSASRCLSNPA